MKSETDFDDIYGSKYFSVGDLRGEQPRRKIGKVDVAELKEKDGTTKRKYIVYFEGEDKALVLNKTNAQKLAQAVGKDRTKWVGLTVQLYAEMTSLGKEGVRLRPLRPAATVVKPDSELNDFVPFLANLVGRASNAARIFLEKGNGENCSLANSGSRNRITQAAA